MRSQVASYIISLINCDFLQFAYIKKDMEIRLQYFTVGIPVRARLVANVFLSCLTWDFKSAEALIFKSVWVILHVKIQNWSKNEDRYALWSIQVLPVASTNPPRRFQKNNSNKSMNFTLKSDTFPQRLFPLCSCNIWTYPFPSPLCCSMYSKNALYIQVFTLIYQLLWLR